jgi:alpha-L-arabinofuranosidase
MKSNLRWFSAIAVITAAAFAHGADANRLLVKADQPGATFGPLFYGLMTEEINHCYDGGLYAELIQNRIFKDGTWNRSRYTPPDSKKPPHWSLVTTGGAEGNIELDTENPVNTTALTTSLRLDMKGGGGKIGVANDGYWGIPIKPNTTYRVSFYARASEDFKGPLKVAIEGNDDATEFASATVDSVGKDWKKYSFTIKTGDVKESASNRFVISAPGESKGSLWINFVSLFPPTYNDRPNGLRPDVMEKLAELQPKFLRFPGGNYLEGPNYENRFNWKTTIGPLEERPGHECPWSYRSSDGLGLLEFLEWCEDLKMEPVLAVYAGLHIDGGKNIITGDALKPRVQDALDEIEYVTGDATTTWGARRIKDGHPTPFKLTYVEIGNEDNLNRGVPTYDERFGMFYDAIKTKYPNLQIISTIPPNARQPKLSNLSRTPDVIDDHLYATAANSMRQSTRHDKLTREGPKIFMGEWASNGRGQGSPTSNLLAALGDAAFLGGLERNCDLVVMQCYAPLMVNVNPNARQWQTNLIGFNALNSFGSASYYAQKMYSDNRGDQTVPVELTTRSGKPTETPPARGRVGVGTWATRSEYKDMKVTLGDEVVYLVDKDEPSKGWRRDAGDWSWDGDTLRQNNAMETNCRTTVGDASWTDYTYTLKARKLSGAEGFLILFHTVNQDEWMWWNIGGWGNTRSAIQKGGSDQELGRTNTKLEENRWYDIKIELKGNQIRGYLDDKLVVDITDAPPETSNPLYANAVKKSSSGEVILRVVNAEAEPQTINVALQGMNSVAKEAQVEVLQGEPTEMNSIDQPTKIFPKKSTIDNVGPTFDYEAPAYSVNIIRLKPQ